MTKNSKTSKRPPLWKVWWTACRPHTLTAAVSPVLVAYNVGLVVIDSVEDDSYFWLIMQWAAFCMLVQLGTNLHNDYADFVKGADTDKRVGQARATQKGWLTPFQTASAASLVLAVALLLGVDFINRVQDNSQHYLVMILIVVTSIFNAFAYTGGPWPLGYIGLGNFSIGYLGLGDIFVFLYFGLVATFTAPFIYVSSRGEPLDKVLWEFTPCAIQVACLATNIIIVNNLRDRHTDIHAKKNTVAVRFGAKFCRTEYTLMLFIAYSLVILNWITHQSSIGRLLPLLSFPLARKELIAIYRKDGGSLNPHVGGAAKVQFLFCILLSIGIRTS